MIQQPCSCVSVSQLDLVLWIVNPAVCRPLTTITVAAVAERPRRGDVGDEGLCDKSIAFEWRRQDQCHEFKSRIDNTPCKDEELDEEEENSSKRPRPRL